MAASAWQQTTTTLSALRRRVRLRERSPYVMVAMVLAGFIGFIGFNEVQTRRLAQRQVDQYAKLVAPQVWEVDRAGAFHFLNLLISFNDHRSVAVFHADGELFARAVNSRDVSGFELVLERLGLVRDNHLASLVVHRGKTIGRLEAGVINRNVYLYTALATIMLLVCVLFVLYQSVVRVIEQRRQSQQRLASEITQRIQAQEALSESREILETVVAGAPVILLAMDREGRFTLCRGKGLERLGLHEQLLVGREFTALFGQTGPMAGCFRRAAGGETVHSALALQAFTFDCWFAPFRPRDGDPEGVIGVCSDITAIKQAQEELIRARDAAEAASRAKSQFLTTVSHELRTPLNSVIGFALVLLKNPDHHRDEEEQLYLERIRDNGHHLLTIINQILDLSKIEAGRIVLQTGYVDVSRLVQEVVRNCAGQAQAKGLELRAEVAPQLAPLVTDEGKLRQILLNLLANAIKFTEQGTVTVRLTGQPYHPPGELAVSDTGIGIPADKIEEIFEAFHQLDNQASRKYPGTGLGLTITRSLCQALGCRLRTTSVVGQGSTFAVELQPLATQP
jgi:PAS domain S-box-containing protein